jgi:hypothetical protein
VGLLPDLHPIADHAVGRNEGSHGRWTELHQPATRYRELLESRQPEDVDMISAGTLRADLSL